MGVNKIKKKRERRLTPRQKALIGLAKPGRSFSAIQAAIDEAGHHHWPLIYRNILTCARRLVRAGLLRRIRGREARYTAPYNSIHGG
jgi:hypothetical protein